MLSTCFMTYWGRARDALSHLEVSSFTIAKPVEDGSQPTDSRSDVCPAVEPAALSLAECLAPFVWHHCFSEKLKPSDIHPRLSWSVYSLHFPYLTNHDLNYFLIIPSRNASLFSKNPICCSSQNSFKLLLLSKVYITLSIFLIIKATWVFCFNYICFVFYQI